MGWRVPLSDIDLGSQEIGAVNRVLRDRWLTMNGVTEGFEEAFADYLGVRHAIAVTNATAALHLANLALGIGRGDEVITPSLTFVATANAVAYTGAAPVFADVIGEQDFGISPAAIQTAITPSTRAIVVMHYAGYVCDMPAILKLARDHDLAVIEDAAHAPGSELDGRKAGTWGDVACFSFFSNKNLVTGEGGMVVTDRDDLAESIRLMRSHGMTSLTWDRHSGHARSYDVVALGHNYRIDELRSALGMAQLGKLDSNNARRREITNIYRKLLANVEGLTLPFGLHRGISSGHIFPIILSNALERDRFADEMHKRGIQTSVHYPPVHQFTYYRQFISGALLPVTEQLAAREVTLPLYPTMRTDDVELVVEAVNESLEILRAE